MEIFKRSTMKNSTQLLSVGFAALLLAACSSVKPNNSALLLETTPSTKIAVTPVSKPLPSSSTSFAQTVPANEEEEQMDDTEVEVNDPYEGFNRGANGFNRGVDIAVIRPVSKVYGAVIPGPLRLIVRNGLRHLETPGDFINYMLQGNPQEAGKTLKRLVINSTLGLGGAFDVANHLGTAYNPTDFGLTLADWGVGEGSYLVTPILGPSTTRDSLGRIVDIALSPQSYLGVFTNFDFGGAIARSVEIVDQRNRNGDLLDNVIFASPDPYVTLRSTYIQRRRSLASGNVLGAEGMEEPLPVIATAGE